jgi:predicted acetyltransferase
VRVPAVSAGPDIRTPVEADRDAIVDVMRVSLNFSEAWVAHRSRILDLERFRCAYEDGAVAATAAGHRFVQWFGGGPLPMCGVWAVATLPERRSSGLASAAVAEVLRAARDEGASIGMLYPAVLRPYRRIGFELAGTHAMHRLPLGAIPAELGDDLLPVVPLDVERDLEGVKACFHRWASTNHGAFEATDDRWWTERILGPSPEGQTRFVLVRGPDGTTEGFAGFRYVPTGGRLSVDFGLSCSVLTVTSDRAQRSLLAYFRGFRGVGEWVEWAGPPADPVSLLIPEQDIRVSFRLDWMLRLLDVERAFAQRGYAPVDAEAVFAVDDPLFPGNRGPWRLTVKDGTAEVTPEEGPAPPPIPIGMLSAMFSGYLRVADAVRLGVLAADDPAPPALAVLLDGPHPWCPFFF